MKTGEMTSKEFLAGKTKDFFHQKDCDRCKKEIQEVGIYRRTSWFTTDTLCGICCVIEDELKDKLSKSGANLRAYEGCGYVPKLKGINDEQDKPKI